MAGRIVLGTVIAALAAGALLAQPLVLARLRYDGGGDWYNDPDELVNLARALNERTTIRCAEREAITSLTDAGLFEYPVLFVTGHGTIRFSAEEAARLRQYVDAGGFVYADDDYGMDESFRRELAAAFPDNALVPLPFDHPLYHIVYEFPNGLPKIHEHAPGAPAGLGLFRQGRLVLFYTFNTNISDGWSDVHHDPAETRDAALRMGINIIAYALTR